MLTDELLLPVLLAEVAVLAAGLALLFGHVGWRSIRQSWLRSRVIAFRDAVARTLAGQELVGAVPRLPQNETIHVLSEAARTVDMTARGRLATLSAYDLLVRRAGRWCRSERWPLRLKGARLLTILAAGEDVVPDLLDDARPEVRSEAAAWVAHHPRPERIARLVKMLDDDAISCRLVAKATLVRLGPRAIHPVVQHLTTPEPAALTATLHVAAHLGDPAFLEPTLAQSRSREPAVRAAAAQVLSSIGGTEAVEALEALLSDTDAAVRATAAAGLGGLTHWPSAPLLWERLGDESWEVRRASGLALGRLGAPGRLYLQRARETADEFASDMAQQVLDLPEWYTPFAGQR